MSQLPLLEQSEFFPECGPSDITSRCFRQSSELQWHPSEAAYHSKAMLAVVSGLSTAGILFLDHVLRMNRRIAVRLIVIVHATCPTQGQHLRRLLSMANQVGCEFAAFVHPVPKWGECCSWVRFDLDQKTLLWAGAASDFGMKAWENHQGQLVVEGETSLADQFLQWFSELERESAPLTEATAAIPALVPGSDDGDGSRLWEEYLAACRSSESGITDMTPDSDAKPSVEEVVQRIVAEMNLRKPDPLVSLLSDLFKKGDLVTLDKGSRIPPLDVPIGAQFFGIKSLKQTGVISRKVHYEISILDDGADKEIEKYRRAAAEMLPKFSFSVADGSRWIPHAAKPLYETELKRVEAIGSERFKEIISGNPEAFVDNRKPMVAKEAQQHYEEFHSGQQIPTDYIDKITGLLKERFKKANSSRFAPSLSYTATTLRISEASEHASHWPAARRLLLSIAEYPRKVIKDYDYFFRGISAEPLAVLGVMNVLEDAIVPEAFDRRSGDRAKEELACLNAIDAAEIEDRDKCDYIVALVHHDRTAEDIRKSLEKATQ